MAAANTKLRTEYWGAKKVIFGKTVLSGTVTTGEVVTGLKRVLMFWGQEKAAGQKGFGVNEDFPLSSGTVTVHIETTDGTFYWVAVGDPN